MVDAKQTRCNWYKSVGHKAPLLPSSSAGSGLYGNAREYTGNATFYEVMLASASGCTEPITRYRELALLCTIVIRDSNQVALMT